MSTSTRATAPKTRRSYVRVRSGKLPEKILTRIIPDIQAGALVILPTETVYGLGTSAFAHAGIRRIYALKGRAWRKPLALLVASLESARPLVEEVPPEALRLAKHAWPGPLTLVLKASLVGRMVTGGLSTIAVRIPDHPIALSILKRIGIPLATTSVNRSGQDPAISGTAAAKLFGRKVEWMIDAGTCRVREASSVVDLSHYPFSILREGAIPKKELERLLGL